MTGQLQKLVQLRGRLKSRLTLLHNKYISTNAYKAESLSILNNRIAGVKSLWQEFVEAQTQIEDLSDDQDIELEERDEFDTKILKVLDVFESEISLRSSESVPVERQPSAPLSNNFHSIPLPKIDLPEFTGKFEDWLPFYEVFKPLIHENPSLDDTQRLLYLKSCLKGEAKQVVVSLKTISENYEVAWESLREKFENKRILVQNHVNALLFSLEPVPKNSPSAIRSLLEAVTSHTKALKVLDQPVDHWDSLLIQIMISKLDEHIQREWEKSLEGDSVPRLKQLVELLTKQCRLMESMAINKIHINPKSKASVKTTHITVNTSRCPLCENQHKLNACPSFLSLSIEDRIKQARTHKLCLNCLRENHVAKNCFTKSCCRECNKRHHSLLHLEKRASNDTETTNVHEGPSNASYVCKFSSSEVLLSTAYVNVRDAGGKWQQCRALLDVGSQSNFISESLSNLVGTSFKDVNMPVSGIGSLNRNIKRVTQVEISPLNDRDNTFDLSCLVIPKITENLPVKSFDKRRLNLPNLRLADPSFNKSGPIDLLLGADIFWSVMLPESVKANHSHPHLQNTQLGWLIGGSIAESQSNLKTCANLAITLQDQVARFWEIEQVTTTGPPRTRVEAWCEEHFLKTYAREPNGKFVVRLPFKQNVSKLRGSKDIATKRFLQLERNLMRQPTLRSDYVKFMAEYLKLGHMSPVTNIDAFRCYLPHHCVVKESSTTTKVRVVFDGSCKTNSGISLNETLLVGPTIQPDLVTILLRFRSHQYVLSADIAKMYRQVLVHPDDRRYQTILWRENPNQPIIEYELNTVTYGTTSAPFLAIKVLQHIAQLHQDQYPLACKHILEDFYVDDLLTGADSIEQLQKIRTEITRVVADAGFELRKWNSNDPSLIAEQALGPTSQLIIDKQDTKSLGVTWNAHKDEIKYSFQLKSNTTVTKRSILSVIAQLFDPLGLLGPVILKAKLLLQQIWALKLNWDDRVPESIESTWLYFVDSLPAVSSLSIPRNIKCREPVKLEIHGFCDASKDAYGAVIYIRSLDATGVYHNNILCSKSRVAPLKATTIPQLELCAALLLAKLYVKVRNSIKLNIDGTYFWTDSTIVLDWLAAETMNEKIFVANRISEISTLTNPDHWHHVAGVENPADAISRGLSPTELVKSISWWHGPNWLNQETWKEGLVKCKRESRPLITLTVTEMEEWPILSKYSNFSKLLRVITYCRRFIHNCRDVKNKLTGRIEISEIHETKLVVLKIVQSGVFSTELKCLKTKGSVGNKSKLKSLNPFLDESSGLIRVGGRLTHAILSIDKKHPIVLPHKHHITNLLITECHKMQLHGGPQATLAAIRQQYWPLGGKGVVKQVIRRCIQCKKTNPPICHQQMGDLPATRVQPSRPFINTGVDYAGPIIIKEGRGRGKRLAKSYVAVFVCFSTKAIHLELVSDCTSDSFLAAFRRFISRRGNVTTMYSDNGTNFVGANKELQTLKQLFKDSQFQQKLFSESLKYNTNWKFIPANSPHWGGLWEAGVKSVNGHIKRVVGDTSLTFEEMYTFLTQVEACVNSRPITQLSTDPNDLIPLTPGHFLIGDRLTTVLEPDLTPIRLNRLSRWQLVQRLQQHFWRRWSSEYLHHLQQRSKWQDKTDKPFKVGSLVLLCDDNLPPLQWKLGRIQELHPGSDGLVRAVTVKTLTGSVRRAINRISILIE
jgi:hypothetical protein